MGYDFKIKFKVGNQNVAANALSQRPATYTLNSTTISSHNLRDLQQIIKEVTNDPQFKDIYQTLIDEGKFKPHYTIRIGVLLYKDQLVLPHQSEFVTAVHKEFHYSPIGDYAGCLKTIKE